MIDPLSTIVWSPTVVYKFPIRNATVAGSVVTVKQINHHLETGDSVVISGSGDYSELHKVGAVTKIDSNNFSYTVTTPPTISGISPQPGQKTDLWLTCPKYSTMLSYPGRLQFWLTTGHEAKIQTFENGEWTNQVTITSADDVVDVFFDARYKDVRLVLTVGSTNPTVTAYHANSPPPSITADKTYHLPIFTGGSGGALTPVGIPGTYDIVTTNEYGQVVVGAVGGGTTDNNIYTEMMNNGSVNIPIGAPVRKTGDNTVELAQGNATKKGVIGIAYEAILIGQTKLVLVEGTITMSTGNWDVITGGSGGLVNDDIPYFLDFSTPGKLVKTVNLDTAPANSYLVGVGYAINPNKLKIDIDAPIKVS